jgi:hypothetical protein
MTMRTGFLLILAAACLSPAQGQNQPKDVIPTPSAKELFLHPRQMPYGVQDETPAPVKPKSSVKPKPTPKPATDQAQSGQPAAQPSGDIVRASYTALALRYTVQKRDGSKTTDVPADTKFHSGDHIQLSVQVNDTGYLYIVSQGTSGTWKALFPSPEIADGDNHVQRGPVYTVPQGYRFTFSGDPGVERMFAIFSRQPVQEIDSLIYSLKGVRHTPAAEPGPERPAPDALMASATAIDDSQIEKMRAAYSRDLIIEKDDQEQGGQQPDGQKSDHSVYVGNPKGSPDSRVVADIPLTHK